MASHISVAWSLCIGSALFAGLGTAHAQRVQIESAVVESASGTTSAISRSTGGVDTFFTMQKKLVYDTLQGIGIPLDSLPPEVRTRLAQFQTRNFEAFRAFANGLNAQDEGKFAEAKAHFRRALELDPSFAMAKDMEGAMPQSDTRNALQLQAVLRDAVKSATQAGKDAVVVDLAHAVAAMMSGMTVMVGQAPAVMQDVTAQNTQLSLANPPGAGDKFGARSVVGISYTLDISGLKVGVASTTDWSSSQVKSSNGSQLVSVGDQTNFIAQIGSATHSGTTNGSGNTTLPDGTLVSWGEWIGGGAVVTGKASNANGVLDPTANVSYMMAQSTNTMPSSGTATLSPAGGSFQNVIGNISADFGKRQVQINNLGFSLQNATFAGLNGLATYGSTGSGFFSGNYSSGNCSSGCSGFSPNASSFTGNFVGKSANGLIFSSILQTGNSTGNATVSGVHLFKQ